MITVNENGHAKCDACGARPDDLLVHLSYDDTTFTLCESCGIKLVKAVAGYLSIKSSSAKRELTTFFGKRKRKAA